MPLMLMLMLADASSHADAMQLVVLCDTGLAKAPSEAEANLNSDN